MLRHVHVYTYVYIYIHMYINLYIYIYVHIFVDNKKYNFWYMRIVTPYDYKNPF